MPPIWWVTKGTQDRFVAAEDGDFLNFIEIAVQQLTTIFDDILMNVI